MRQIATTPAATSSRIGTLSRPMMTRVRRRIGGSVLVAGGEISGKVGGEVYRPRTAAAKEACRARSRPARWHTQVNRGERPQHMKLGTWIAALGLIWLASLGAADGALADPGKLAR